jgi:hypothetical protein
MSASALRWQTVDRRCIVQRQSTTPALVEVFLSSSGKLPRNMPDFANFSPSNINPL